MSAERPPSSSERLLRSTLQRNPPQAYASPSSSPRAHRRRHSHVPPSTSVQDDRDDDDDQFFRAAFLQRTAATASSPVRPTHYSPHQRTSHSPSPTRDYYSHDSRSRSRAASPSSHYNRGASPSPRRQSLQRSPASVDGRYGALQRHNSTPARRRSNAASSIESQQHALPLTPHEQVLRARLERVLISGRVVDERERSREHSSHHHASRRRSRDDSVSPPGWPWSEHSVLASTPPKSSSSSDHGHSQYLVNSTSSYSYQTHHRSRSKTDPLTSPPLRPTTHASRRATTTTPAPSSPHLLPKNTSSAQRIHHAQRNNSNSSSVSASAWTPPLTADVSPILSDPEARSLSSGVLPGAVVAAAAAVEYDDDDVDTRLLLTPPPTPPLWGTATGTTVTPAHSTMVGTGGTPRRPPGVSMYRSLTHESTDSSSGVSGGSGHPYLYQHRRGVDGSVEQLALPPLSTAHSAAFNARRASERCRMMEGYVSFAQVEGLGIPSDGVDDHDERGGELGDAKEKRGRVLNMSIGTWARKLFVGNSSVAAAQS